MVKLDFDGCCVSDELDCGFASFDVGALVPLFIDVKEPVSDDVVPKQLDFSDELFDDRGLPSSEDFKRDEFIKVELLALLVVDA